jgi:hypothetical protein
MTVGDRAFSACKGLMSIYIKTINPPSIKECTFYNVDKSIPVYVPAGSVEDYRNADYWNKFTNIIEDEIVISD